MAANLPLSYVRSAEYELVCATPLTNQDWYNAFKGAVRHRSRALVWLVLAVLPMLTAGFGLAQLQAGLPSTLPALGAVYLVVLGEVALVGLYEWAISLGVSLALWTRWNVAAALVALLVPLGWWGPTAAVLYEFGQQLPLGLQPGWLLLWGTALALAPFALARSTARWGERWARGDRQR